MFRVTVDGLDHATVNRAPQPGENSIAVLVTHALGAERALLHIAAARPIQRDRDQEFGAVSTVGELTLLIDDSEHSLPELLEGALQRGADARSEVGDSRTATVGHLVVHALAHTAEHLAHAELTRHLLERRRADRQ